ncbi:Uncharacterised protein r2_g3801 [Pycnogonum litorale]
MAAYDPETYDAKIEEIEERMDMLNKIVPSMQWSGGQQVILDVGSGPGTITKGTLYPVIKRYGISEIIGVDTDDMVEYASKNNSTDVIHFKKGNIEVASSLPSDWIGKFDKAFSFFAIQDVISMREAFNNVNRLLKEGGEIGFLLASSVPLTDVQPLLSRNPKWRPFLEGEIRITCGNEIFCTSDIVSSFTRLLEQCGLEPRLVEEIDYFKNFENMEDYIDWMFAMDANQRLIPSEIRSEYKQDLYDLLVKVPFVDDDGKVTEVRTPDNSHLHFKKLLHIHAVKM